jgi:hypothetical protein
MYSHPRLGRISLQRDTSTHNYCIQTSKETFSHTFHFNDLTFQQLIFNLRGEHTFLYVAALYTIKKTVFQYVNIG